MQVLELDLETMGTRSLLGLVAHHFIREEGDQPPAKIQVRLLHRNKMFEGWKACQLIDLISYDIAWLTRNNCEVEFID